MKAQLDSAYEFFHRQENYEILKHLLGKTHDGTIIFENLIYEDYQPVLTFSIDDDTKPFAKGNKTGTYRIVGGKLEKYIAAPNWVEIDDPHTIGRD